MSFFDKFRRSSRNNGPDLEAELQSHLEMSSADRESRGADTKSAAEQALVFVLR